MTISRRGLFGLFAGVVALPVVAALPKPKTRTVRAWDLAAKGGGLSSGVTVTMTMEDGYGDIRYSNLTHWRFKPFGSKDSIWVNGSSEQKRKALETAHYLLSPPKGIQNV